VDIVRGMCVLFDLGFMVYSPNVLFTRINYWLRGVISVF
jgi:hypothetical protein